MAGNASSIYAAAFDSVIDTWISEPNGTDGSSSITPTITASGTTAGYSTDNLYKWDRSLWKSSAGTSHTLTLDYSGTIRVNAYNVVVVWLHECSTTVSLTQTSGLTSITLETSATGAFAGEEVTESSISSAQLFGNAFGAYAPPIFSRCLVFKTAAARAYGTSPYIRLVWAAPSSCTVQVAKVSIYAATEVTNIVRDVQYDFGDRNIYNQRETGRSSIYARDYQRNVSFLKKYNTETSDLLVKMGWFNRESKYEPLMLFLDYDSDWSTYGEHIHTFPVQWLDSASYTVSPQYSTANMYSDLPVQYSEFV